MTVKTSGGAPLAGGRSLSSPRTRKPCTWISGATVATPGRPWMVLATDSSKGT